MGTERDVDPKMCCLGLENSYLHVALLSMMPLAESPQGHVHLALLRTEFHKGMQKAGEISSHEPPHPPRGAAVWGVVTKGINIKNWCEANKNLF